MGRSPVEYVERRPAPELAWAVKALWGLEGHPPGEVVAIAKPYVEFIVSLGDDHLWRAGPQPHRFAEGWITPLQSGPRFSKALGLTRFVAARLEPHAAAKLFGRLPLGDGSEPLGAEAVLGADFRRLRQLLGEARDATTRLEVLEAWLGRRLARLAPTRPPVLARALGAQDVDAACEAWGIADRSSRRRFQTEMGCSPKYWLRLHRLAAVIGCPRFQAGAETLATTAARFGLADQAHLAREFRLLASMPPSAYQQRRWAEGLTGAPTMVPAGERRFFQGRLGSIG